jgi:Ankyrin repeats (3 copies)
VRRQPLAAVALCFSIVLLSCGGPRLKKILRDWYVDDVPDGKPSPHLYWVQNGKRVVVDREILSYETKAGCLLYETSRPNVSRALFGVLPGKIPVAAAASDSFRPWHLGFDGARRFDPPRTDENGATILGMDYVEGNHICSLAYQAPPFREDWAQHGEPDFSKVELQHTDFDVHGVDSMGKSTLMEQVRKMHPDEVDALLAAGADVNAADNFGNTPLTSTMNYDPRATAIMRRLLDAGAIVDAPDSRGMTALMWAASRGKKEAVTILLEHGANPTLRDDSGRTPAAMTGNSKEAADLNALLEKAAAAYKRK